MFGKRVFAGAGAVWALLSECAGEGVNLAVDYEPSTCTAWLHSDDPEGVEAAIEAVGGIVPAQ